MTVKLLFGAFFGNIDYTGQLQGKSDRVWQEGRKNRTQNNRKVANTINVCQGKKILQDTSISYLNPFIHVFLSSLWDGSMCLKHLWSERVWWHLKLKEKKKKERKNGGNVLLKMLDYRKAKEWNNKIYY